MAEKPKVRGPGSNQYQDKPPETSATPAADTAAGRAVGGVADADPLAGAATPINAEQRLTMLNQVGKMNVLAISGGRVSALPDGIELPVSSGYKVRVRLDQASDTYTVQRVMVRGLKEFPKGERSRIYADQVGETAYRAGMYNSWDEDEW